MADQSRTQPSRQQPRRGESLEPRDPELERRSTQEPSSIAHDSGRGSDEAATRSTENRASDELGSEAERETGISEFDDEDLNGRSDR